MVLQPIAANRFRRAGSRDQELLLSLLPILLIKAHEQDNTHCPHLELGQQIRSIPQFEKLKGNPSLQNSTSSGGRTSILSLSLLQSLAKLNFA